MARKKICPVSTLKQKCQRNGEKRKTPFILGMKKRQLLLDNKKEEFTISKLEKDLKIEKSACSSKAFCDDGLDYILETCDKIMMKPKYNRTSQSVPLKNDPMVGINRQKGAQNRKSKRTVSNDNSVPYITKNHSVWRVNDICQSNDMSLEMNSSDDSSKRKIVKEVEEMSAKTCVQKPEFEDCFTEKQLICLKRQVKGLLNRLAETNMHKVVMQLEALYLSNSRNIVNRVLVENIITSLISTVRTPERLIQENVMLIAILHSNIDVSIGVRVVYTAIKEFHALYQKNCDIECKKLDNLIIFIAHLYTFKIVGDVLVYDVLNLLLERFSEKDIELILSLLRNVGISLRKSNSTQLKELILKLQRKASEENEIDNGSRAQYMIDIVLAIKNNNIQKLPNYNFNHIEHLKKLMKGFLRPGSSGNQIKFSYEDIIKAVDHGHLLVNFTSGHISEPTIQSSHEKYDDRKSEVLSKLVKKHRMNTDVRRHIFSVLVTSQDYLDAYEKIIRLDLSAQQECEVTNLIVHCALQGKTYSPFYQLLASRLTTLHRKYLLSLRCSVWDKLEQFNSLNNKQVSNLGQFVSHCIIEGGLPLSTLKVLDLGMMDQRVTTFIKDVMLNILVNSSSETYEFICKRSTSAKHAVFTESLWLYIKHIICSAEVMGVCNDVNHLQQRLEIMRKIFGL